MPKSAGYTLVELMVVIVIISLLAASAFVYYRSFTQDQYMLKAADRLQSEFRTAQSNATSNFACAGVSGADWSIQFPSADQSKINLNCSKAAQTVRSTSLENIQVDSITTPSCSGKVYPSQDVNISFSALFGSVQFSGASCLAQATTLTITLKNKTTGLTKNITLSKGGAINVQLQN